MSAAEPLRAPWIPFRNILFAMDLSPASLRALPFAASIARHYGGKLILAHIVPAEDYASPSANPRMTFEQLEAGAEEGLLRTLGSGLADVPHEVLLDHGSIPSRLMAAVESSDIDLIVLGTHGWQGIKKLIKGSTAQELAHLATRPVLTVGPKVSSGWNFRSILYETNFSRAAEHAFPFAASLARVYEAFVIALHVNESNGRERPDTALNHTIRFVRTQMRNQGYGASSIHSESVVRFGGRAESILDLAAHRRPDLIVMGLNCRKALRSRIAAHLPGSADYSVLSEAHCPVLTVPFVE